MFTGLVEAVGRVRSREPVDGGVRLEVGSSLADELEEGESVCVDGVCLTVCEADAESFRAEAGRATLARTTLGGMEPGRRVNLERALRAGDPLSGHLVQGHVDAVGRVSEVEPAGETVWLRIELPEEIERFTVERGSLAVDGVSLTVHELDGRVAEVAVIPYTWEHTALDRLGPAEAVNLEADLLGKYVDRLLRPRRRAGEREGRPPSGGGSHSPESRP